MSAAETEALQLFITQIQTAFTQFNNNPGIFPAAMRMRVELTAALQSAVQAHSSSLLGDLAAVKTHLREAISHLELTGVLIAHPNVTNPIDVASYVVRQHYIDFLDREPDQSGNDYWVGQFSACGTDARCFEEKRIHVSAAFFLSIEFQRTGYFVHRLYRSSYARVAVGCRVHAGQRDPLSGSHRRDARLGSDDSPPIRISSSGIGCSEPTSMRVTAP